MTFAARRNWRVLAVAVPFGLALAACSRQHAPPAAAPVPVTVVKATTRDMPILASAIGSVEPINSVSVKSMVDGQLLAVLVKDGDFVDRRTNCCSASIRVRRRRRLHQAEAALAKDQAALDQARSEVKRNAPVAAKGYISADQMEQLRTNLEAAAASIKVDQANIAAAKVTLGYTEIRAPIAGRIGRILIQPGNLLKANDTNPLVVINQIEPIYVNFALPGMLLGRALRRAEGMRRCMSRATITGVAVTLDGKVAFVDNAVDATTGTVKLRARVRQPRACAVAGATGQREPDPRPRCERGRACPIRRCRTGRRAPTCSSSSPIIAPSSATSTVSARRAGTGGHREGTGCRRDGRARRPVARRERRVIEDQRTAIRIRGGRCTGIGRVNVSEIFVRRPVMTTLVMVGILVFGIVGVPRAAGCRAAERRFPDDHGVGARCRAHRRRRWHRPLRRRSKNSSRRFPRSIR